MNSVPGRFSLRNRTECKGGRGDEAVSIDTRQGEGVL